MTNEREQLDRGNTSPVQAQGGYDYYSRLFGSPMSGAKPGQSTLPPMGPLKPGQGGGFGNIQPNPPVFYNGNGGGGGI